MASKKINGITIAINADTSGVTAGLKGLTSQSVSLSKQLKTVDGLLKLDPKNTELLATKQKLLSESVETTKKKLQALKGAQEDVKKAVASGSIGTEEYVAFQKELVQTERRLKDLEAQENGTADSVQNLGDDTAKAGNQMQEAGEKSGRLSAALKTGVEAAAKAAAAALAAVTAAAAGTVAAVVKATGELAAQGDEIDKNSQKLGMSAQAYQEWDFIMQHSGSDIDKMSTSMKKLADAVQEPTKESTAAFEKLGISIEDAANMSQEDLFQTTITALQGLESGTERTALANDLLGKSAMDLGALLNMSADETEAMRQEIHDLGGVLSDDAVEASAAYQDSLQNVKTAIGGVKNGIASQFMPSMIQMMNSVTQIASGNLDAVAGLEMGVDNFVGNIEKMADDIAKKADKIIPIIIKVISNALPKLAQSAVKIIGTLGGAITKNLPQLMKAAAAILTQLVKGISQKLPTLIPAAVKMLTELVSGMLDHMGIIVDGALSLITGLADGIINSLPILVEKAPEIVCKLVDGIVDALPKILDAGAAIIGKLFDFFSDGKNLKNMLTAGLKIVVKIAAGIKNAFVKIVEKGKEIIEKVWEGISQKISDAVDWGKQLMWNFLEGVESVWKDTRWWQFWSGFGEFLFDAFHPGEVQGQNLQDWENKMRDMPALYDDTPESYRRMTGAKGIPVFGSGGVVTVPTKAIIGENGAEAVVPLENNTAWIDKLAARLNRAGGGGYSAQINVTVYGNNMNDIGNQIAAKIDTALRRYQVQQTRGQGGTAW